LTNTQHTRGLCHNKKSEPESFVNKPGIEQEINHPIAPLNAYSQIRQMPTTINLDSSGLSHATTMTNQNAHLCLASPQSFSSARILLSTFFSNLSSGLISWVQFLAVKVQVSSTPKVSCHVFTLLPFEPVTSTTQISSAKTALEPSAEMQPSADSNNINNASSFDDQRQAFFHISVGCCIYQLDIKSHFKQTIQNLTSRQNQKQNAIHLSLDCWIQASASEDTAASFGRRLVIKYHFRAWAQLT
jgi:hypothetical protein